MSSASPVTGRLQEYGREIEGFLGSCLRTGTIPESLVQAMEYSLLAGGKRLRPVLCLTWAELAGVSRERVMPFACAIECIHTYSLIHDDLPAMDDDDLRRGRPSCHKRFDEATAILAGDGLLTEAFTLMTRARVAPDLLLPAIREMAVAAGPRGMVGGQVLDMAYTAKPETTLEELRAMHGMKTGALIRASCTCGAILAGAGEDFTARAAAYGEAVGLAFQVVDDILDIEGDEQTLGKPVGSDQGQGKTTYPGLIGIQASRDLARDCVRRAAETLEPFSGSHARFLLGLAEYVVKRGN
ncbi:MAG TPA: farnesyl diphosphate synthase [Desulfomicrobiaceae bacterium]|jgi:geranylgeranyl diphosphate synthase type II|nr:farnesyl diphosphate synthase [Desulfomicrobiaceae bacterium]